VKSSSKDSPEGDASRGAVFARRNIELRARNAPATKSQS